MKKIAITLFTGLTLLQGCAKKVKKTLVIGHRGAMGYEMENTLASIEKALELEVDMIEIDVFKVRSGELVVFHDEKLDRLTNRQGNIEEYSYQQLKEEVVVNGKHSIPLLVEVLKKVNGKAKLNIELKGANTAAGTDQVIRKFIKDKGWQASDFIISSFDWKELQEFRNLNKEVAIGVLTEEDPLEALSTARSLDAYSIHPDYKDLTAEIVEHVHMQGFRIFPYTVNDQGSIEKLIGFGVDGIISDYPDHIR